MPFKSNSYNFNVKTLLFMGPWELWTFWDPGIGSGPENVEKPCSLRRSACSTDRKDGFTILYATTDENSEYHLALTFCKNEDFLCGMSDYIGIKKMLLELQVDTFWANCKTAEKRKRERRNGTDLRERKWNWSFCTLLQQTHCAHKHLQCIHTYTHYEDDQFDLSRTCISETNLHQDYFF